jgi:hypothetical protein
VVRLRVDDLATNLSHPAIVQEKVHEPVNRQDGPDHGRR